jgi:hypothetical protein
VGQSSEQSSYTVKKPKLTSIHNYKESNDRVTCPEELSEGGVIRFAWLPLDIFLGEGVSRYGLKALITMPRLPAY